MLHIDCKDTPATFNDIAEIRGYTAIPIDLHLISPDPEPYFQLLEKLAIEYVSIQYEDLDALPVLPTIKGTRFGIALKTDTPITVLDEVLGYDYVMLMCTTPGESGGSFDTRNFQRIIQIKQKYPHLKIQIDGGVNDEVAYILRLLGVDSIVSGSFLMNHYNVGAGLLSLHRMPSRGSYTVESFMSPTDYLPVLRQKELQLIDVLKTIEHYKQGYVLIVDENRVLKGIITNADVRKGLIAHYGNWEELEPLYIVNTKPVTMHLHQSLAEMIALIQSLPYLVLFLPIINDSNQLVGAVALNNLTRG